MSCSVTQKKRTDIPLGFQQKEVLILSRIDECTGLILAGGKSSRMGQNKALLQLEGKSLLQWQTEKLRQLGVGEILISAPKELSLPGIRTIPDHYRDCGPIGGLHAGLAAASCGCCLVIGVDWPLVPAWSLSALCRAHEGGVTILRHPGGEEPLLGVYDRTTAPLLEQMILQGVYAVRALERYIPVRCWDYSGPEEMLCNCNSPEDFYRAGQTLAKYRKAGIGSFRERSTARTFVRQCFDFMREGE